MNAFEVLWSAFFWMDMFTRAQPQRAWSEWVVLADRTGGCSEGCALQNAAQAGAGHVHCKWLPKV
jgi:hypothetical protein